MKIFIDPKVFLIAEPKINWKGVKDFLAEMEFYGKKTLNESWIVEGIPAWDYAPWQDADLLPEFCGRMCYCSFGERQGRTSNIAYLHNIIESGHGSVLEHANFTFLVTQCSRGFTHEMVRHRAGFAYSQESTHYIDYSPKTGRVILDAGICGIDGVENTMRTLSKQALNAYELAYTQLKKKYKKKDACSMARQILPIGIEAKLAFTANVRALRHFCLTRGNSHNAPEIRKVACKVFSLMLSKAPSSMQGLILEAGEDGGPSVGCTFGRKV